MLSIKKCDYGTSLFYLIYPNFVKDIRIFPKKTYSKSLLLIFQIKTFTNPYSYPIND